MSTKQFRPWAFPPNAIHVSLDLETASTEPDAAIVQIGAASRNSSGAAFLFNSYISLYDCERQGLHISKETMEWWDKQDPAVRKRVFGGEQSIKEAIEKFIAWCTQLAGGNLDRIVLWGNGCNFDNVILKNAVEIYQSWPFHYRNDHHLRTLMALIPPEVQERMHNQTLDKGFKPHDALDDAVYQEHMIYKALVYHGIA